MKLSLTGMGKTQQRLLFCSLMGGKVVLQSWKAVLRTSAMIPTVVQEKRTVKGIWTFSENKPVLRSRLRFLYL